MTHPKPRSPRAPSPRQDPRTDDPRARFLIELGRALGTFGVASHRLEDTLMDAAHALGIRAQVFSTPTSVFLSTEIRGKRETMLSRVEPRAPDLAKIVDLDEIHRRVIDHRLTPAKATRLIKRVVLRRPRYPAAMHVTAIAVAAFCVARFFGGGWREMLVAAITGLAVGTFAVRAAQHRHAARLLDFAAGALAAILASLATVPLGPLSIKLTVIAGLIVLMPGMSITTAMAELATRNLVSGTARLVGAVTVILSIGFGVAGGTTLATHLPGGVDAPAQPLPDWTEIPTAALAPFAFVILFNARFRDAVVMVPAGVGAFVLARLATGATGTDFGVCITAAAIGIAGNIYARTRSRPASTVVLPGLLMLVPGSLGFRSFEFFLANDTLTGTQTAFKVLITALALVAGLLLANVAAPPRRSL